MKTYEIRAEDLASVLRELAEASKPKRIKVISFCGQDEKHLVALVLEAYAERYQLHNAYVAAGFAELARVERIEH